MAKPDIVHMVVPRNYVLRSTRGHAIQFTKDEPIWVPRILVDEVLAIGGAFVEKVDEEKKFEEKAEKAPPTESERVAILIKCFKDLIKKNDPTDWTGSGMPSVRAIEVLTGLNFTTKEVKNLWIKFQAEENAENKE